jgi:formylglycine-generating enzyme required for sulfatase activity
VRECGDYVYGAFNNLIDAPLHLPRHVLREVKFARFSVAEKEVTNAEYEAFLRESGYRPRYPEGFLAHWENGHPRKEDLDSPVLYVDIDDARAYATWAGLRLPTEDEWQLAVETHSLPYGSVWNWTESEHTDGRTTFSLLKGGCKEPRGGSEWYADSGPKTPAFSAKLIHFWPHMDRSEMISFRCAGDV